MLEENEEMIRKQSIIVDNIKDEIDTIKDRISKGREELSVFTSNDIHSKINKSGYREKVIREQKEYKRLLEEKVKLKESEENLLRKLEHEKKNEIINNIETVLHFMLNNDASVSDILSVPNTQQINKMKAEVAEAFHLYKKSYPEAKFIKSSDSPKQKFIRLIYNIILKPDGQLDTDKAIEFKEVYDSWKNDVRQSDEMLYWLKEYNVFSEDEYKSAKEKIKQKSINFKDLFK